MKKLATTLASLTLLGLSFIGTAAAQNPGSDAIGTWVFNIKLDGAPPCQCIEITKISPDGTVFAPANDHFSGDSYGVWANTGYHTIAVSLAQNNINPDGTAGGVYLVKFTLNLAGPGDQAAGTGTVNLTDNTGASVFSTTFSIKGSKLKVP